MSAPQNIEDQIEEAAKKFKEAIEACGKNNVVIAYAYKTAEEDKKDHIVCGYQAGSFTEVLGSLELIKDMLLHGDLS
jgi:hypothetical protein